MTDKSVQNRQRGFFSFDLPNFPTFKAAARQHRTLTFIFSLVGYTLVVSSLITVIVINQQIGQRMPVRAFQSLTLLTGYGSQRLVFSQGDELIALHLKGEGQVITSTSLDGGESWQEAPTPLISERIKNLSAAQDGQGNLHLVYEGERAIVYRKVDTQVEPWSVSEKVTLDQSGLGHRPTITLDKTTQLPLVVWSSEFRGISLREARTLFLGAKADPTNLNNWCNAGRSSCGTNAFYIISGSANTIGSRASYSIYHPVLAQMPQSGNLYLWWSNLFPSGKATLQMAVGKKEGSGWKWGEVTQQDTLSTEAAQSFTLSALADEVQNQVIVSYVNQAGEATMKVYTDEGVKVLAATVSPQVNSLGKIGDQFSLSGEGGNYYLLYRNLEGKVGIKRYSDGFWSAQIWESSEMGGYPSAISALSAEKLTFMYVTAESKVKIVSQNLTPSPAPSLTPLGNSIPSSSTPSGAPTVTLEATPPAAPTVATAEPTATPSPTPAPTSIPEVTP